MEFVTFYFRLLTFCLIGWGVCGDRNFLFFTRILYFSWLGDGSIGISWKSVSNRNSLTSRSPSTSWFMKKKHVIRVSMRLESSFSFKFTSLFRLITKNQRCTLLAHWGIHWWSMDSPYKRPVMQDDFPYHDVIMMQFNLVIPIRVYCTQHSMTWVEYL